MVVDSSSQIIRNDPTNEWLIEILSEKDLNFKKRSQNSGIQNIVIKEIGGKKGLLAYVFRILLEFENGNNYSFVIKKPTLDPINGLVFENVELNKILYTNEIESLKNLHYYECQSYELIRSIENVLIPKIYCLEKSDDKNAGFIAMEDFCEKATTIGLFQSPTQQHCLNIARHLGHFQAQMNKQQHKWKGKHLRIGYVELFDDKKFSNALKNIGQTRPEFENHIKMLSSLDIVQFYKYSLQEIAEKLDATTFCHGDLSCNNIMIKLAEDGSLLNEFAAIIDWQLSFEGTPYTDLARFLVHSFDADLRRSCEKEAVDLQYDTFCEASKKLGLEVGYTREEAHKLYEYTAIQQSIRLILLCNAIKSRNPENANEEVLEAQCEKLFLRCRLALDDSLKKMEKYGIVERFAK